VRSLALGQINRADMARMFPLTQFKMQRGRLIKSLLVDTLGEK
jgi:hypothetical protein